MYLLEREDEEEQKEVRVRRGGGGVLAAEAAEDLRQMERRVAKTHSPRAKHSSA